jgi:hypothetical protein
MARTPSARPTPFARTLTLTQLRERGLEVPPVAVGTHPTGRARDPTQLAGAQEHKLVRLARAPLHANPVPPGHERADAADTAVRHAHTIAYTEAACHTLSSTLQPVAI